MARSMRVESFADLQGYLNDEPTAARRLGFAQPSFSSHTAGPGLLFSHARCLKPNTCLKLEHFANGMPVRNARTHCSQRRRALQLVKTCERFSADRNERASSARMTAPRHNTAPSVIKTLWRSMPSFRSTRDDAAFPCNDSRLARRIGFLPGATIAAHTKTPAAPDSSLKTMGARILARMRTKHSSANRPAAHNFVHATSAAGPIIAHQKSMSE